MRRTKMMVGFIVATLLTWFLFGLVGILVTNLSFKECLGDLGMLFPMFLLGWIPGVVVMYYMEEKNPFNKQ